jgi:hypothetical protein
MRKVHQCTFSLKTTRAKMFKSKTVMVINNAPAQANRTQLS